MPASDQLGAPSDIRALRQRRGLTQQQLAERLHVTPLTVLRWESGQSRPRPLALAKLREVAQELAASDAPRRSRGRTKAPPTLDFAARPEALLAVAEAHRLAFGHQFNPAFATEISRIDPLPHQRIAVYEAMLRQDPLRFLLADDAGAGKTIMTGLAVREMLSRSRIRRVLVVPPAGLVGNWERELGTLFRLRFSHRRGRRRPRRQSLRSQRLLISRTPRTARSRHHRLHAGAHGRGRRPATLLLAMGREYATKSP